MRSKYRDLIRRRIARGEIPALGRNFLQAGRLALSVSLGGRAARPLVGTVIPTYRCDSACPKCAKRGLGGNPELSTAEIRGVIDGFVSLGVAAVDFSGGEPLLRGDIVELVRHAASRGVLTHLNTNARRLDRSAAAALIATGLSSVNVSVDSLVPERGPRLTGTADGLAGALAGLRHLLEARARAGAGTIVTLVAVLQRENLDEASGIVSFGRELGVDAVTFNPLHRFPDPLAAPAVAGFSSAAIERLIALKDREPLVENSVGYFRLLEGFRERRPLPLACVAGRSHLLVDARGRVFPCYVWLERGGGSVELGGRPLAEVVRSPEYRAVLEEAGRCRACYWNCHAELSLLLRPFTAAGAALAPILGALRRAPAAFGRTAVPSDLP